MCVAATSRYHKKPLEYAMHLYAYYECHRCKEPYFAGQKSCQAAVGDVIGDRSCVGVMCRAV
jgi:hypothetical protein